MHDHHATAVPAHEAPSPPVHPASGTMRAVVQDRYGPPDVLYQPRVPVPTPARSEIRVRVVATSVNARDWHIMRGEPRLARLLNRQVFGRKAPRVAVRGTDFAGIVDSVGDDVHDWNPGDRVFGETDGTLAEYARATPDRIARIPDGVPFGQAAAVPLAAITAATCLDAAQPTSQAGGAGRSSSTAPRAVSEPSPSRWQRHGECM